MYRIWNEDCIQGMADHIESNSIDLVLTDPPYGIDGANIDKGRYARDESLVIPGYIDVPSDEYASFSMKWISECSRCLRPGGSIYVFSGFTNLRHVLNALYATDLREVSHIIWKYNFGVATTRKFVNSHYHILFWYKPPDSKRVFNTECRYSDRTDIYHDIESVITINRDNKPGVPKNKNQLSEALVERLLLYSSDRGSIVMDPFMGGFTIAKVALKYGRNVVGFELNKEAYDYFNPLLKDVRCVDDPIPIEPEADVLRSRDVVRMTRKLNRGEKRMMELLSIPTPSEKDLKNISTLKSKMNKIREELPKQRQQRPLNV